MQYFSSTGTTPLPLLGPINLLALCHLSKIICVASVHPTVLVLLILTPVKLLEAPLTNKCLLEDHLQYLTFEHFFGDAKMCMYWSGLQWSIYWQWFQWCLCVDMMANVNKRRRTIDPVIRQLMFWNRRCLLLLSQQRVAKLNRTWDNIQFWLLLAFWQSEFSQDS